MSNIRFRFSSNESPFGAIFSHQNKSSLDSWIQISKNSATQVREDFKNFVIVLSFRKSTKHYIYWLRQILSSLGFTIKAMYEIFSKLHFYICKLQFRPRLFLFIIDSLKIISLKLIVTLPFCLFAEDQSRNLNHKFSNFK